MTPLLATEPPLYVNSCNACVCTYKLKSFNLCTHTRAYIYFTRYRWLGGRRELRFPQRIHNQTYLIGGESEE